MKTYEKDRSLQARLSALFIPLLALRISLFIPCFIDQLYPNVAISMVKVFERLGHTVEYDERQTCCGQPAFNSGYWPEARSVAERMLDIFRATPNTS